MWVWKCVAPHPPIIVPEVGQGRESDAHVTISAMNRLSSILSPLVPDVVFLLSPHAPCSEGLAFTLADRYSGNFSQFGAPERRFGFHGDIPAGEALARSLSQTVPVRVLHSREARLDHGCMVPLSFFPKSWENRVSLIVANPIGLEPEVAYRVGELLRSFEGRGRWGLLASSDLSHRLSPEAPAGYDPIAHSFDDVVVHAIEEGSGTELLSLPESLIERAGECGYRSVAAFLGLSGGERTSVLSYEGPYGVGYCVAYTIPERSVYLPALARYAVGEMLSKKRIPPTPPILDPSYTTAKACFVSLKTCDGNLRGCIGTILPQQNSLVAEVISNAISAALRDPRFPPVDIEELPRLGFSVDVLSEPEDVTNLEDLNPRKFGVILEHGSRRGVLLPDLEGIDTVGEQIRIAAAKAGIRAPEEASVSRFTVERFAERQEA